MASGVQVLEHREGRLRPDARDTAEELEGAQLVGAGEAEEGERVLADHEGREDGGLGSVPQVERMPRRHRDAVADPVHLQQEGLTGDGQHGAAEGGDHAHNPTS
jgi:hypothetical protein